MGTVQEKGKEIEENTRYKNWHDIIFRVQKLKMDGGTVLFTTVNLPQSLILLMTTLIPEL